MLEWFTSLFKPSNSILEQSSISLTDPNAIDAFFDEEGGGNSSSGITVTHQKALGVSALFQGASIISGDVAMLPMQIKSVDGNGDKTVENTYLNRLISIRPNDNLSAFEMWRMLCIHAIVWGNGYLFIDRKGESIQRIYNLFPDDVETKISNKGKLEYTIKFTNEKGQTVEDDFPASNIFHLKPISVHWGFGCDLVSYAREVLGLALASESFSAEFFANGAKPSGILEIPLGFTKTVVDKIEEGFRKAYSGKGNHFKTIVLRDGAKYQQTTTSPRDAELNALMEQLVRQVARFLNLPPFKVGLQDAQGFKTAEQQQLVYKTGTLQHWLSAIKAEATIKFLSQNQIDRQSHVIEYDTSKLIEADILTQNQVLEIQRQNLVITSNEWRRRIGLNRSDDPTADKLVNPNTMSGGEPDQTDDPDTNISSGEEPTDNTQRNKLELDILSDALIRGSKRIISDLERFSKKPIKILEWIDTKAIQHRVKFNEIITPACTLIAHREGLDTGYVVGIIAGKYFETLTEWIDPLLNPPYTQDKFVENFNSEITPERLDSLIYRLVNEWK